MTVTKVAEQRIGIIVADVATEMISWLWVGWLALRKLAILDGDPGTGKSTLIAWLVACLTSGRRWPGTEGPDDGTAEAGNVVIVTVEDSIGDIIRPRLEAAGADLNRVTVVQTIADYDHEKAKLIERVPTLPKDLEYFERAVVQADARLLVIDPLSAHLGADVNSYRDQDVRRALAPLAKMAERLNVAVLVVRHLTKQSGGNPLFRGGGSIGIIGAARLGMLLGESPADDETLVLASTKSNIARLPESLSLRIVTASNDVGVIEWLGVSKHSAYDVLNVKSPKSTPEMDAAIEWLKTRLADGDPHPARNMWELAEADGLAEKTVRRALKKLGVVVERIGGIGDRGAWHWSLPRP